MKLQKNTLLALTSVLAAAAQPGLALSAGEIARRHGASAHHLAKVLHTLTRAGVLASTRGVGGGYRFAGNARRLTLMDVIELFEPVEAASRPSARRRARGGAEEAVAVVLSEIDAMAGATLRSITIATMLKIAARPASSPSSN